MKAFQKIGSGLAAMALLAGLLSGATAQAAGAVDCTTFLAAEVDVSAALIDEACDTWTERAARSNGVLGEAPTLAMAWTDVGVVSTDGAAGVAGWPISATCLLTGAITGPSTAYYVVAGVASTLGPATSTTIQCTVSPAGLAFTQTTPGAASAGFDVTATLPGSALTRQTVCSYAEAYYLVRPLKMTTGTLPCSQL